VILYVEDIEKISRETPTNQHLKSLQIKYTTLFVMWNKIYKIYQTWFINWNVFETPSTHVRLKVFIYNYQNHNFRRSIIWLNVVSVHLVYQLFNFRPLVWNMRFWPFKFTYFLRKKKVYLLSNLLVPELNFNQSMLMWQFLTHV
jgi:hypothetical protein